MKKTIFKNTIISLLLILSIPSTHFNVYANGLTINSVTELDLGNGEIIGENVDFRLNLPTSWLEFLIVYREDIYESSKVLEKISLKYKPLQQILKPVLLMNIYVIDKTLASNDSYLSNKKNLEIVVETTNHIFAVESPSISNIPNARDKELYNALLNYLKYRNFIELPENAKILSRNTLSVDGVQVFEKSILVIEDTFFIPLRQTCEYLGFDVLWIADLGAINIVGDDIDFTFRLTDSISSVGFESINRDSTAYVDTLFFSNILDYTVHIDENHNVYLT